MKSSISKKLKAIVIMLCATLSTQAQIPIKIEQIKAPFEMPQLERPDFPNRSISIEKTGAKQNKLSTKQIQKAIDRMAEKGGGVVMVPAGKWITGRIVLKSNVNLHIDEGAELHFSGDIKDYLPVVQARYEGVDALSLGGMVYANGAENIALTGKGKLVGPDYSCEILTRTEGGVSPELEKIPFEQRIVDGAGGKNVFMPAFFGAFNCKNILVEGVTFEHSIFWNIVPTYCENVIIRGVTVNSHGQVRTDGIDIDSSVNVLIEYTTLSCGDDCFTLKAGRGNDGMDRNRPTENVVIRHCTVKRGVGGIAIGSETAAMIRNVYAHDCVIESAMYPFYMKSRRPRGGGGENVLFERIHVKKADRPAIFFDMLGSPNSVGGLGQRLPKREVNRLTPVFRNFTFRDITIDDCPTMLRAKGLPESPIENLTLENVKSNNLQVSVQDIGTMIIK